MNGLEKKGMCSCPLKNEQSLKVSKESLQFTKAMDDDDTVCESLEHLKPTMFANGGDRKGDNVPEGIALCNDLELNCFGTLVEKRYNRRLGW